MKNFILIFLLTLPFLIQAKDYTIGTGSEFKFNSEKSGNVNLSIYITESSFTRLGIEYFFSTTTSIIPVQLWQQFQLGLKDHGITLDGGYIQSDQMKKAETMSRDFLDNNPEGVNISDFFFSKQSDIDKYKIGIETQEVPAGSILATHYRKTHADQTVDFWISDKAGEIGLVKLQSKGKTNKDHDYTIELMSLLKNVKAKINPKEAVPLSEQGKALLSKEKFKP